VVSTDRRKDKWHNSVVSYIRSKLNAKEEHFSIKHPTKPEVKVEYRPDVALKKDGKYVIIEVESYRGTKILEDLLFPSIMDEHLDSVIIIFSNKERRGQRRVKSAKALEQILRHHFPNMPIAHIKWVEDENDERLTKMLKILLRKLDSGH